MGVSQRVLRPILYVGIVVLAANAIRLAPRAFSQQNGAVIPPGATVVPYTVTLTETLVSPAGVRSAAPSQTYAVRSDGTTVMRLGDGTKSSRQIRSPFGIEVQLSDALRAKSTMAIPTTESWFRDPRTNCTRTLNGGVPREGESAPIVEQIAGYRTVRMTTGSRIRWYALDHGCALIRRISDFGAGGSSRLELVVLIPGEPSAALFNVPDEYTEGPPSSFVPQPGPACDADCQESRRQHFERLDARYFRNRP